MKTIAFHGSKVLPWLSDETVAGWLERDMQVDWVDEYFVGHDVPAAAERILELQDGQQTINLFGYSEGGKMIGELTHELLAQAGTLGLKVINSACVYEGYLTRPPAYEAKFPVLFIRNDRGRGRWYGRQTMEQSVYWWSLRRQFQLAWGVGRHMRFNPIGHGYDRALSGEIKRWFDTGVYMYGLAHWKSWPEVKRKQRKRA